MQIHLISIYLPAILSLMPFPLIVPPTKRRGNCLNLPSILFSLVRARVQCFSIFAFTSSPFGRKAMSKSGLSVKASPFFLHRFFATNVVQGVVYQVVVLGVKVNAGFAFTLNRLIYSLLWGEVKGEGKNGKFW